MTKPKTLDQLRAEKERAETQLAQEKHKLERLEKRKRTALRNISTPPTTRSFGENSTQTSAKYFGIWRGNFESLCVDFRR